MSLDFFTSTIWCIVLVHTRRRSPPRQRKMMPGLIAPASPATAAKSTGACATGGPAQLPTPSLAVAPATIAQPWALGATHKARARLTALVSEGAGATLPCDDLGRHHCKKGIVVLPEVSCWCALLLLGATMRFVRSVNKTQACRILLESS